MRQSSHAFSDHMFKNYNGALKADCEVGNKKVYDSRAYLPLAEAVMVERAKQVASDLRGSGKTSSPS